MIKKLNSKFEKEVLDFAYKKERENLFVIGSFKNYPNTLEDNNFYGYFSEGKLVGLATWFSRWGSFVVNAEDKKIVETLTEFAAEDDIKIEHVPCFKQYAETIIETLKNFALFPKKVSQEMVLAVNKENFIDLSTGEEQIATKDDLEEIIIFDRIIDGENLDKPITEKEKKRIIINEIFLLKKDGKIVTRANPHGYSKNYFQIGGVGTLPEHRGKGYAKQVVSFLCKYYFKKGIANALLFTNKENIAAQKVYKALGFKEDGDFVIAEY